MLGILLALGVSEWAKEREHQTLAKSGILNISKEISSNLEILTHSRMYSIQRVYKQTGMQLSESAMNATAYTVALGTTADDRHFQEQFVGYFQLLIQIEPQLLGSYRDVLDTIDH